MVDWTPGLSSPHVDVDCSSSLLFPIQGQTVSVSDQLPRVFIETTGTHVEDSSAETTTSESAISEWPSTTIVVVVHVAGTSRWSSNSTSGRMDVLAGLERLLC